MDQQTERFVHYSDCVRIFNNAWWILKAIQEQKAYPPLVNAAFQFALVEYAKPYLRSRGVKGGSKNLQLCTDFIPSQHRALHDRIITDRNQIHAHGDLSVKDAKVYLSNMRAGRIAVIAQNITHGTELMSEIDAIIALIEETLDKLYPEIERLEKQLPTSP